MMATTTRSDRSEALAERLFEATIGALELHSVHLGMKLGLYGALASGDAASPSDLAERAGIAERYAREWLEQQAVAGFVDVAGEAAGADSRRYTLAADQAAVFVDPDSAAHVAPFAQMLAGIGQALPAVADAYRSGGGVAYRDYGEDFRHGQGGINRPAFVHDLPESWLPAIPDVHARLLSEPPARVAEIGCGQGWAAIGLARAYPLVRYDGYDLDRASVEEAQEEGRRAGIEDRVSFHERDATDLSRTGPYDLVLILETLHDLPRPVESLAAARAVIADGGSVIVADERVADLFAAPGDEIERMMYGWSVLHCLPSQMVEEGSAATGTVMRTAALESHAAAAGFARVEVLTIENPLFRFYRLRP